MQSEQQTTQTKKSTTASKVKKQSTKPKSTENVEEVNQQQEQVVDEQPVTEVKSSDEQVVIQELELSTVLEFINTTSDKLVEIVKYFKDNTLSKEERTKVESGLRKFQKSSLTLQQSYSDYLSKQVSVLEKSSGSKSGGVKKVTDKEKSAIHKKLTVQPFLLNFMKLEPSTLVSRSDALTAITGFVKQEKLKNPDIIVENDKRSFKLIGELKTLFDGIGNIMKSKNLIDATPTQIKYTQIMQYMTHCFIKDEPVV